jgi:uridylate kinase
VEIGADLMLKATKVDGIYTADPKKDKAATKFDELTYDEALDRRLGVMDQTAMVLCRDHKIKLRVYDMDRPGALLKIVMGDQDIGTRVHA